MKVRIASPIDEKEEELMIWGGAMKKLALKEKFPWVKKKKTPTPRS